MNAHEALAFLDAVLSKAQGTRAEHEQISAAVAIIAAALPKPPTPPVNGNAK